MAKNSLWLHYGYCNWKYKYLYLYFTCLFWQILCLLVYSYSRFKSFT